MLPQRLLLHDPSAAVVLSTTLRGGVGALNTNSITDITRHPFVTTASVPPTASSSSIPQSLKSAIAMNSRAAGRPITALCTQLIDLKKSRTDSVTDSLEDGACFCGVLSQDTIQIFSRNWTVHIFQFHDDLQSITHDREHLIVPLEASGRHFALLKTLVGFGLGRGGRWTRVGYIAAGAAARGSSPFSLSGTHWKGIGAELDMAHMNKSNGSMAGRAESSAQPSSSTSSSSSSSLCHMLPMEAALHLFESLSSLPDIPILKISGPKTLNPAADSSFSNSSGSGSGMRGSASKSGGSGFGFGFGNMSSKPRPAVIVAEDDSLSRGSTSTSANASSTKEVVETARAAFCTALTARFQGLFQFCHAAAVQTLLSRQAQNSRMSSGSTQYFSELAALSVLSLNPIDGDGEGEGEGDAYADVIDEDDHTKADGAVEAIIELCDFLRPTVCSLLKARTPEEAALVMATHTHTSHLRGSSGDNMVLTYVLAKLFCRLHAWSRTGAALHDKSKRKANPDQILSMTIASKFCALQIDESALNCLLSALCENILSEVSIQGQQRDAQVGVVVGGNNDSSKAAADGGNSFALSESTDSKSGSTVLSRDNVVGGTSVMNCLVSSSQNTLYQIFVLTAADKSDGVSSDRDGGGVGGGESEVWSPHGLRVDPGAAVEQRKLEDKMNMISLGRLISPLSLSSSGEDGQAIDVFSLLARTKVALWLVDVTPLEDLIARSAMQQFKAKKDSMDIFLEMVLAGQTDKLFMLAKADRNNTGTR